MEKERRETIAFQAVHNRAKGMFLILVRCNDSVAAADIRILTMQTGNFLFGYMDNPQLFQVS